MTKYEIFANIIMAVHGLLIFFVFLGIFVSIRIKRFRPIEALFLLTALVIWSLYGACPLTSIENHFRNQGSEVVPLLETGFIPYYINEWFSLDISNRAITIATYAIAAFFLVLTIEWEMPLIKKFQNKLAHRRFRTK